MKKVVLLGAAFALLGCEQQGPRPCEQLLEGGPGPTDSEGMEALLSELRPILYPELDSAEIDFLPAQREGSYFWANFDFNTAEDPPMERHYIVWHDAAQFDDPMGHDAAVAVLAHELKHILDYTGMDTQELADFAGWYLFNDVSEYERETDEHALELGCGPGLIEFRLWLYDHVDAETVEDKRHDYYTPEEIEAWMDEHD